MKFAQGFIKIKKIINIKEKERVRCFLRDLKTQGSRRKTDTKQRMSRIQHLFISISKDQRKGKKNIYYKQGEGVANKEKV